MKLLDALAGLPLQVPPVWLMRQAGRYMPSYQALRKRYSLDTLFHEPELATQVTLLPLSLFDVDAAIVFSDILVIAETLGLSLSFPPQGGPKVTPKISLQSPLFPLLDVQETLSYVFQTIRGVRSQIKVPLIGFCGGPFTVATYLIEEELSLWLASPARLHSLLDQLTTVTERYIFCQIDAGIEVLQIFDSWASLLTKEERFSFCYPYIQRLVRVAKQRKIPTLFFCRDSSLFPEELISLETTGLSFDSHRPLHELKALLPPTVCVQGNLDPEVFASATPDQVKAMTQQLLHSMQGCAGWIANLGHGVLPHTPIDNVHAFINTLRK